MEYKFVSFSQRTKAATDWSPIRLIAKLQPNKTSYYGSLAEDHWRRIFLCQIYTFPGSIPCDFQEWSSQLEITTMQFAAWLKEDFKFVTFVEFSGFAWTDFDPNFWFPSQAGTINKVGSEPIVVRSLLPHGACNRELTESVYFFHCNSFSVSFSD